MVGKEYIFDNFVSHPQKGWVLRFETRSAVAGTKLYIEANNLLVDSGAAHCAVSLNYWNRIVHKFKGQKGFNPMPVGQEDMAGITGKVQTYPVHVIPKVAVISEAKNKLPFTLLEILELRVIVVGGANVPFIIGRSFLNCGKLTLDPFINKIKFETKLDSLQRRVAPVNSGYFNNFILPTVNNEDIS